MEVNWWNLSLFWHHLACEKGILVVIKLIAMLFQRSSLVRVVWISPLRLILRYFKDLLGLLYYFCIVEFGQLCFLTSILLQTNFVLKSEPEGISTLVLLVWSILWIVLLMYINSWIVYVFIFTSPGFYLS